MEKKEPVVFVTSASYWGERPPPPAHERASGRALFPDRKA